MTNWQDVWAALSSHIGFVEGPGNRNPWTEAMGFGDCAYCSAFASVCPHQQAGVQWPRYVQVPPLGEAYSPDWEHFPSWVYDRSSSGQPVDLAPGDIVTYDWNANGVADHTETVVQAYADGSFDTIGANTGSPEGVHYPIRRDRRYLVGRYRPSVAGVWAGGPPSPTPAPPPPTPPTPRGIVDQGDDMTPQVTKRPGGFEGHDCYDVRVDAVGKVIGKTADGRDVKVVRSEVHVRRLDTVQEEFEVYAPWESPSPQRVGGAGATGSVLNCDGDGVVSIVDDQDSHLLFVEYDRVIA